MENIFSNIVKSFDSLWSYKIHKDTIEVITPYTTSSNNTFISVFITKQGNDWVVTDGGWLCMGMYGIDHSYLNGGATRATKHMLTEYSRLYSISNTTAKESVFYYKKTSDERLIPNLVFDLSNFISKLSEGVFVTISDQIEREATKRFSTEASDYISNIYGDSKVKRNAPIDQHNVAKFGAVVVTNPDSLLIVDYITGSNAYYFSRSLSHFNMSYEIACQSPVMSKVEKKIALIDNNSVGYNAQNWDGYLYILESKGIDSINWSDRERFFSVREVSG